MVLPLFAVTLFVSAFLLFLVQPMIGKMILPRLGGTPQVWNTCMVFFQTALLAGYAYTHTVSTRFKLRRQLLVHGILLLIPLAVLLPPLGPFHITGFTPPAGGNPVFYTLYYLTLVVGLPFFVVSTSAPLLQRWFGHTGHPSARDPYFLYGASNLGSMLALLAYPFLVEPILLLKWQAGTWAVGYILLVLMVGACALIVWKAPPEVKLAGPEPDLPSPELPMPPPVETSTAIQASSQGVMRGRKKGPKFQAKQLEKAISAPAGPPRPEVITWWRRLRWVILAAAPSSLMLGAITYMSTDLSPIPLFWVLPLALYLLTFILVFARWPVAWTGLPHTIILVVQPFLVFLLVMIMVGAIGVSPLWRSTAITLLAFFFTTMVCHGELARDRPSTRHLTEFYLWMSVGGMLGGMFNGLIAPLVFKGVAEYGIALVAACFMRPQQKVEGWSDEGMTNAFPGLVPWFRDLGQNLEKIPTVNFLLIVLLGGAILGGIIFLISDHMELPRFASLFLYSLGLLGVIVVLALRFQPGSTLSFTLDGFYPLLLLCLGSFLLYNGTVNWNWLSGRSEKNFLLRLAKSIGFGSGSVLMMFHLVCYGIPLVCSLFFSNRPLRYGLAISAVLLASIYGAPQRGEDRTLFAGRSYFGVLKVYKSQEQLFNVDIQELKLTPEELQKITEKDEEGRTFYMAPYTYLMHGTTHHGLNFQYPPGLRRLATTYYHRKGPTGIIMEKLNWFPGPQNTYWADSRLPAAFTALGGAGMGAGNLPMAQLVCAFSEPPYATVGLGTGTMASYGRPFQHVTFYEIDNNIRSFHLPPYAPKGPFFNYLYDAIDRGTALEVIMGDARLSMKDERPGTLYLKEPPEKVEGKEGKSTQAKYRFGRLNPKREKYYRVIELDAFSSDAIPVHLITKEAIEMYFEKLVEQGVLCVHTSNRHVDLVTPVVDIANNLGLAWRLGKDNGKENSEYLGHFGQEYVMLARKDEYLPKDGEVVSDRNGQAYMVWSTPDPAGKAPWTDDYSNLAGALRESLALTIFFYLMAGIGVFVVLVFLISQSYEQQRR